MIPSNFFQHIYLIGCAFNLHSIINSGLILGGQNSSKRQTVFFLPVDPMDKSHKDADDIDLNDHVMHNTCTMHGKDIKTRYIGSTSILPSRKDFSSVRLDPKVVRMKTGEVLDEKVYMSPRPPPKISLKHEWKRELGSELARQCSTSKKFPTNSTNSKSNS